MERCTLFGPGAVAGHNLFTHKLKQEGRFEVCKLELVELLALSSGDAPLTDESHGPCRLRLIGSGDQRDLAFADADRARDWIEQLMSRSRCEL